MGLSNELISQFAKITNDKKTSRIDEVTLYGEVLEYEDMICVRFDGSKEITPVTTIVEKEDGKVTNFKYGAASVKTGDRVSVSLKNHSATITGNLTDPPPSRAEVIVDEDSILARVDQVSVKIDSLGVTVNGLTTFTNGLTNGTTTIDGGCIDANTLNLTGSITFSDLATDVTDVINNVQTTANDAAADAITAIDVADDARAIAKDNTRPDYIKDTYISKTEIRSPTIKGNNIKVYGTFQTIDSNDTVTGYMGAACGEDENGNTTYGVALSNTWSSNDYSVGDNYVIVTDGGVRMQAGSNRIFVTSGGIQLWADNGDVVVNGKVIS